MAFTSEHGPTKIYSSFSAYVSNNENIRTGNFQACCYDKKLEATKGEFLESGYNQMEIEEEKIDDNDINSKKIETEDSDEDEIKVPKYKEIDTVLTTEELIDILKKT